MDHITKINNVIFKNVGPISWKNGTGIKVEKPGDIKSEQDLFRDLGADSLDQLELYFILEKEFDTSIPCEIAKEWLTVGDVYKYFEKAY